MTVRIDKKIVGFSVQKTEANEPTKPSAGLHERLERPERLTGKTYKIKPPDSNALYITINDIVLDDGKSHPFEIFINSKAMNHFQWTVALTRMLSAVFRKGGEIAFAIEELKSVHDPNGGFFYKGRYVPSLVAAIGGILERHLIEAGIVVEDTSLADAAKMMLAEKVEKKEKEVGMVCEKCHEATVVVQEGCAVCKSCGWSRCG